MRSLVAFLLVSAVAVTAVPLVRAQAPASGTKPPAFEVASIKVSAPSISRRPQYGRNTWTAVNVPLHLLLVTAFDVGTYDVVGLPDWVRTEAYSIDAKADDGVILTPENVRPLLRQLLVERFKLLAHRETVSQRGFALVVSRNGSKMNAGKDGAPLMSALGPGQLHAPSTDMHDFARVLETLTGQPVSNETGLAGNYEFTMTFATDGGLDRGGATRATDSSLPSVFTALEEQLGLKLEPRTMPVEVLVIDHVERPTEN